jgi:hypothetical protein
MPLTAFQTEILRLLAAHRSPESFLAGATVLNAGADTPRYSRDLGKTSTRNPPTP